MKGKQHSFLFFLMKISLHFLKGHKTCYFFYTNYVHAGRTTKTYQAKKITLFGDSGLDSKI